MKVLDPGHSYDVVNLDVDPEIAAATQTIDFVKRIAAEAKVLAENPGKSIHPSFHCHDDECEDCFGC